MNHSIWFSIREEIKEQNLERKIYREEKEFDRISKNKSNMSFEIKNLMIHDKRLGEKYII